MAASSPQAFANWKEKQKMTQNASTSGDAPGVGHNSAKFPSDLVQSYAERIENLEVEKKAIADDIRDVYAEVRGAGFDVKALRAVIRERKIDPDERAEQEQIKDLYRDALGMLA